MTTEQTALLELVRMGATGECLFTQAMYDADWKKLLELAGKQGVACVAWRGIETLYKHEVNCCPVEVKLQWYAATQQATKHYHNHLQAIKTLSSYLAEKGMRMMVLKGYALSLCYPIPSHRPCGDIDIYLFGENEKCDKLLEKSAGIEIDESHHHHTIFRWNSIPVENHYDFTNVHSHSAHKWVEPYLKALADEEGIVNDGILVPSPTFTALFAVVHSAGHFAAESVELRHLVDWYLLCKHYKGQIDWDRINKICKECGYDRFLSIWNELALFLFESSSFDEELLSKDAKRVLNEILHPRFSRKLPQTPIAILLYKLRRWWCNRWKMNLVYTRENIWLQFGKHIYSYMLKPKSILK